MHGSSSGQLLSTYWRRKNRLLSSKFISNDYSVNSLFHVIDVPYSVISSTLSISYHFISHSLIKCCLFIFEPDYPESSSRILNHVPSFQGLDVGHSHHKHGGLKPGCAQDLPFCLYDNDYPTWVSYHLHYQMLQIGIKTKSLFWNLHI